ncbi:hypothetical protein LEP1GSC021_1146 [Leptospira noguchii str. 1993005606]|nr:hypothetical protein LEP1GSC021_1146 [Leptospira noguchii str. 1993005606]
METQHNALYESRWKLSTTLSMNRVVGWELRGFVVIPTDLILRSKYLWGWLWSHSLLNILLL